ncbi:hypothetical protein PanWU01x14_205040, partial [Parasponia andersonii]
QSLQKRVEFKNFVRDRVDGQLGRVVYAGESELRRAAAVGSVAAGEGVSDVLEWAAVEGPVAVGESVAGSLDMAGEEEEEGEGEDSGDGDQRERDWVHRRGAERRMEG